MVGEFSDGGHDEKLTWPRSLPGKRPIVNSIQSLLPVFSLWPRQGPNHLCAWRRFHAPRTVALRTWKPYSTSNIMMRSSNRIRLLLANHLSAIFPNPIEITNTIFFEAAKWFARSTVPSDIIRLWFFLCGHTMHQRAPPPVLAPMLI